MRFNAKIRFVIVMVLVLTSIPARAVPTSLKPGESITIDCLNGNVLTKKKTTPTGAQNISARLAMSLDSTGTILTINIQNTSTVPDAVLYAVDLGLPRKFANVNRMEGSFSQLPAGARWYGPTDASGPTNAIGSSTLAAREVLAVRMEDFLPRQKTLSAGFLRPGQSGIVTIKLTLSKEEKQKTLQLDPVAYFLANDPSNANNRMQIASTSVARAN